LIIIVVFIDIISVHTVIPMSSKPVAVHVFIVMYIAKDDRWILICTAGFCPFVSLHFAAHVTAELGIFCNSLIIHNILILCFSI